MPRGGRRIGAGRPKGSLGYSRRAIHEASQASGETPIAYILRVMRDEDAPDRRRDKMAALASYLFYSRTAPVPDVSPEDAAAEAAAHAAEEAAQAAVLAEREAAKEAELAVLHEAVRHIADSAGVEL